MPLMERMRGFTKVILYALVFAFVGTIIFDWGMDFTGLKRKTGIVAEINGQEIHVDRFWRLYQDELTAYQQRYGTQPSEAQQDYIRNQVWDSMVRRILERQAIDQAGLAATNEEIYYYLVENPPDFIKNDTSFAGANGQFDREKYQAALANPLNDPIWKNVEDLLRENLPLQKLYDEIRATVYVTESEVREEYLNRNQKATVAYLFVDPGRFQNAAIEIDEADVRKLYEKNRDNYKQAEQRKIDYVIYSTQPTAKDTQAVAAKAQELLERARSGEDFATLAKDYSDDEVSSAKGGDLDYFKRGTMVKPFEEAAFNAKIGEIVGPVRSNFGFHIIKITAKKKEKGQPMVRASHILLKYVASPQTRDAALDSADYLAVTAKENGWEKTLEAEHLVAQSSPFFQRGSGFIPGLGIERSVARFVFKNGKGDISDPILSEKGYVVVRIADIEKERTKTLDEVRPLIENELKLEHRKNLAGEFARKIKADIDNGATLEAVAANDSLELKKSAAFTRSSGVPEIGQEPEFIGTAFALEPGQVSEPVRGVRGYYLIKLMSKSEFDKEDFNAKKTALRNELARKKEQMAYAEWYAALKEKSKIRDYRSQYF